MGKGAPWHGTTQLLGLDIESKKKNERKGYFFLDPLYSVFF